MDLTRFNDLKGQTLADVHVEQTESDRIVFTLDDGSIYQLHHEQDCCENVMIHDIAGEITSSVVVRRVGQSNGYYSERVSFTKVKGR